MKISPALINSLINKSDLNINLKLKLIEDRKLKDSNLKLKIVKYLKSKKEAKKKWNYEEKKEEERKKKERLKSFIFDKKNLLWEIKYLLKTIDREFPKINDFVIKRWARGCASELKQLKTKIERKKEGDYKVVKHFEKKIDIIQNHIWVKDNYYCNRCENRRCSEISFLFRKSLGVQLFLIGQKTYCPAYIFVSPYKEKGPVHKRKPGGYKILSQNIEKRRRKFH